LSVFTENAARVRLVWIVDYELRQVADNVVAERVRWMDEGDGMVSIDLGPKGTI